VNQGLSGTLYIGSEVVETSLAYILATLQFCQKYGTNEIENGCIFANQRSAIL